MGAVRAAAHRAARGGVQHHRHRRRGRDLEDPARGTNGPIANRYPLNAVDFADASRGVAVGNCGVILLTANGGDSWRRRLHGSCTGASDIAATDATHLWAAQTDGRCCAPSTVAGTGSE